MSEISCTFEFFQVALHADQHRLFSAGDINYHKALHK
jgi:hypothetical protein